MELPFYCVDDDVDHYLSVTLPGGQTDPAKYHYDGDGRLIAQEDAYGNRIEYDHDLVSRQEIVTDRSGNVTASILAWS